MASASASASASFTVNLKFEPFEPVYTTLQDVDFTERLAIADIPEDFLKAVADQIANFTTYEQIISNYYDLQAKNSVRSIMNISSACTRYEITRALITLANKLTSGDDTYLTTRTPDFSGFTHLQHFDEVFINFAVRFTKNADGDIVAKFEAIYTNKLATHCYLLKMYMTLL